MSTLQLAELIGNQAIRTQLTIASGAARLHNRAMGHVMFSGLPGCGKTTTARALALLRDVPFFEVNPESIRSAEDLAKLFSKFPGDGYDISSGAKEGTIVPPIVFIDEAHRLTLKIQELLGIAMEEFRHTYSVGRGQRKQTVTEWVPDFTLVCATTKVGDLSKPYRDRFMADFVFGSYTFEESVEILRLHAGHKRLNIDRAAIEAIAARGRGTPRVLVRFLLNMEDQRVFLGRDGITKDIVEARFELMGMDSIGLTPGDITIMKDLYYSEGPIGLDSLSVRTNLDPRTIAEVNEPYLIRLGFIERSKSGRIITEKGIEHLISEGIIEAPETKAAISRVIARAAPQ
jgi:Holliday junction DNA helicase RuvB